MAYTPKEWENGDIITAEDLNHLEQGVAGAGGGTVEVSKIKIATADVYFNKDGDSDAMFVGGTEISGSQILDLIGDKTVIGVEMVGATLSAPDRKYPIFGVANFSSSVAYVTAHFNLALATKEEIASITGVDVNGIIHHFDMSATGGTVDIYAICI